MAPLRTTPAKRRNLTAELVARVFATQDHFKQSGPLMVREVDANPPTNVSRWISVKTESGMSLDGAITNE
ncbi:hypothetical protein OKW11_005677 [Pseudomonas baetica]|nr:hypothetical protein [Pseudomonas baetica]